MDFANETPLRMHVLAARFKLDAGTFIRWVTRGIVVRGRRVKLAARKVGGTWFTTERAWLEFQEATNPDAKPTPPAIPTEVEHRNRVEEMRKNLRKRGLKV